MALAPWGKAKGHAQSIAKVRKTREGSGKPHSSLSGMSYPANKPALWPIEGGMRASATVPTEAYAERYNAILTHAYVRAGHEEA
jgi:hypothetical protein